VMQSCVEIVDRTPEGISGDQTSFGHPID
jgi:hypothetical protein